MLYALRTFVKLLSSKVSACKRVVIFTVFLTVTPTKHTCISTISPILNPPGINSWYSYLLLSRLADRLRMTRILLRPSDGDPFEIFDDVVRCMDEVTVLELAQHSEGVHSLLKFVVLLGGQIRSCREYPVTSTEGFDCRFTSLRDAN